MAFSVVATDGGIDGGVGLCAPFARRARPATLCGESSLLESGFVADSHSSSGPHQDALRVDGKALDAGENAGLIDTAEGLK